MSDQDNDIRFPMEWVIEQLQDHELEYDYKTDSLRKADSVVEEALAISFLRLDAREQEVEDVRSYIRDALNVYRHECAKGELRSLIGKLSYAPDKNDLVATWVKAICGKESVLDVAAIKHFIWQVKRKLNGLPIEHHLMPILMGQSGIGKSVAVLRMLEPLKAVSLQTDMSIFDDSFSRRAFSRNFIGFFDELNGADETNVNAIKQIITAPVVEWRVMRSERVMSAVQNCTFIGCSNEAVRERIKDATSSRRFWQMNCADRVDWEAINSIDYLALWKSIDENAPAPILEHLSEIRKIQEKQIRAKDTVEQWVEEMCEVVTFDESCLTTSELYESFKEFCTWQNQKSFPQFQKFARELKRIMETQGNGSLSKKTNKGTCWSIRVQDREAVSVASDGSDGQLAFDLEVA